MRRSNAASAESWDHRLWREGSRLSHVARLPCSYAKRVLGEAQADATFDAVVKGMSVEFVQRFRCERDIFELDKAHRTVLLRSEAKTLISALLGEYRLELIF